MGASESEIIRAIKLVGDYHAVDIFDEMVRICDEDARVAANLLEMLRISPRIREWDRDTDIARRVMHEREVADSKRHADQWRGREFKAKELVDG